jgi:hypothetical protein
MVTFVTTPGGFPYRSRSCRRDTTVVMRNVALFMILLAFAACDRSTSELSRLVRDYDEALILAFRTGDLASLRRNANEEEVNKVAALVDLKRAAGLVLEAEILSLDIESIEHIGPEGAVVHTTETWKYHDRAVAPGTAPGETFVSTMSMQYSMERHDGEWRVTQVRTVTNEFLEPKGFKLDKRAHGAEASQ